MRQQHGQVSYHVQLLKTLCLDPTTGLLTVTLTISNFQFENAGSYTCEFELNGHITVADGGSDAVRVITPGGYLDGPSFVCGAGS
jgi:hypothetical protein